MKDFFIAIATAIFLTALTIFGIIISAEYHLQYRCHNYQEVTDRQTKYVFMDNCYINTGTEWLTRSEYKAVIVASERLRGIK